MREAACCSHAFDKEALHFSDTDMKKAASFSHTVDEEALRCGDTDSAAIEEKENR